MNRSIVRRTVVLASVAAVVSCSSNELTPAREEAVRSEGTAAAGELMSVLQFNLVSALEEGGPVEAVEFCAGRALALTDSVSESLGEGISIKRVSELYRNPKNAPDASEFEAIHHFETVLAETGRLPDDWVQQTPAGELRYYKAVTMQPPCLTCHGSPDTMDPGVVEALGIAYADDHATGYEAGDFRGLIRVSVSEERIARSIGG
ncbi:MAG: Tll0287-like domain-containing protein [Gemmatimonadota bacterium]